MGRPIASGLGQRTASTVAPSNRRPDRSDSRAQNRKERAMNDTKDSGPGHATPETARTADDAELQHQAALDGNPYRTAADPLGRLVRRFGPLSRRELRQRYLQEWGLLVLLAVVLTAMALWYGHGYQIAVGAMPIAALVFLGKLGRPPVHMDVHQHGLRWQNVGRRMDLRWSDIIVVRADLRRTRTRMASGATAAESVRYRYHVTTFDDRHIVLSEDISGVLELGAIVQRETLPYIMQRIVDHLSSGHPVAIDGNARVTQSGIACGKQLTPWSVVRSIEMMGGTLRIAPAGTWATGRIDNVHALVPLIRVLAEEARPPAAAPSARRPRRS